MSIRPEPLEIDFGSVKPISDDFFETRSRENEDLQIETQKTETW